MTWNAENTSTFIFNRFFHTSFALSATRSRETMDNSKYRTDIIKNGYFPFGFSPKAGIDDKNFGSNRNQTGPCIACSISANDFQFESLYWYEFPSCWARLTRRSCTS